MPGSPKKCDDPRHIGPRLPADFHWKSSDACTWHPKHAKLVASDVLPGPTAAKNICKPRKLRALGIVVIWTACAPQVISAVDDPEPPDAAISSDAGADANTADVTDAAPETGSEDEPTDAGPDAPDALDPPPGFATLLHRYSFDGTGTLIVDTQGQAHGTLVNGQLLGDGKLDLTESDAGLPQYVDLPNNLISRLGDATFEMWVTWEDQGKSWQRIFDFGTSDLGETQAGSGTTYLFLTPRAGNDGPMRGGYSVKSSGSVSVLTNAPSTMPAGIECHLAFVIDDTNDYMHLYMNGVQQGSVRFEGHLSAIVDNNNWLGRSQFTQDAPFTGTYDEFRIYGSALNGPQIRDSLKRGVNATSTGLATYWTAWLNSDAETGTGDREEIARHATACANPINFEARVRSTRVPYYDVGERVTASALHGLTCLNADQPDGVCEDYEIRFLCPTQWPVSGSWSDWASHDNPDTSGDFENTELPCREPWAIEAQTLAGVSFTKTGEFVRIEPDFGLVCLNSQQVDGMCEDYRVRYFCPE